MQIERTDTGETMSQAVAFGDTVYLAGQVSSDVEGVAAQTEAILTKVDALLEQHGTQKTRILSAVIHLADMSTFSEMNDVWKKWVPVGATPARTTVEAKLVVPRCLVEITIIAAR